MFLISAAIVCLFVLVKVAFGHFSIDWTNAMRNTTPYPSGGTASFLRALADSDTAVGNLRDTGHSTRSTPPLARSGLQ
ncbi:MAG: hypothetical protein ACYCPA_10690, partial [Acidithiobacillus sp.]